MYKKVYIAYISLKINCLLKKNSFLKPHEPWSLRAREDKSLINFWSTSTCLECSFYLGNSDNLYCMQKNDPFTDF